MTRKDSPKPAILFIGTQMAVGGAQNLLLSQADWFHANGYPVTAAFLYDRDGLSAEWQAQHAFPLVDLRMRDPSDEWARNSARFFAGLMSLWKLIRQGRFSVILSYTHHANMVAMPLAWLGQVPARVATHLGRIRDIPHLVEFVHAGMINVRLASSLVVASKVVFDQAIQEGIRSDRLKIIPNGIPPAQVNPSDTAGFRSKLGASVDESVLVCVGRLVEEKGYSDLLLAMPAVLKYFPETRLVIVGYGPLEYALKQKCHELGISERVHFMGWQEDSLPWIALADVFVLPSRSEGLPLAVLEAMSLKRAIVATRVGGIPEALQDDVSGSLVPAQNPPALADAIVALLSDPARRQKLGQSAGSRFEALFSLDRMCSAYLDLFQNLLKRR